MEQDDVLSTIWSWDMDELMCIFRNNTFAELFVDAANGWKQIIK